MPQDIRDLLESAEPKAVKALVDALDATDIDGRPDHDLRSRVADRILDRLRGKPAQAITGEDGGPVRMGLIFLPIEADPKPDGEP